MEQTNVAEVLMHHLAALQGDQMDEVLLDYTEESVLMSPERTFRGLAEIRAFYEAAKAAMPDLMKNFTPIRQDMHGEIVYTTWKAEPYIKMGTDTFVIRNGKIFVQTFLIVS